MVRFVVFEVLMFGFGLLLLAGAAIMFVRGSWKRKDGPKWYQVKPPMGTGGYGMLWFYVRRQIAGTDTWSRVNIAIWAIVTGSLSVGLGVFGMTLGTRVFQSLAGFEILVFGLGLLCLGLGIKRLFRGGQMREDYLAERQAFPPAKEPGSSVHGLRQRMVLSNLAPWSMVSSAIGGIVMGLLLLAIGLSGLMTVVRSLQ